MNETIYLTLTLFIILGILFFIIDNDFSNVSESFLTKKSLRKTRTAFRNFGRNVNRAFRKAFVPRPSPPPPPRPAPYVPHNILRTYDAHSIMREYGLPINIQSNQPCTFDEQCSTAIGLRSSSQRYCLAHHGSRGVCVTEDGCRNNQKNINGYENTTSCKGVTFGNIYGNVKRELNTNIIRGINTSTGWSEIASKLEISSPSVPPIPSLETLKNRVRYDFKKKLPNDIKDIFDDNFSLPLRPVNNTYFIDYTNYQRNQRGLMFEKWVDDSKYKDKIYSRKLDEFNQDTSKWIKIKYFQKILNNLLDIVTNNHRSDNAKRDVVVEWYKRFEFRNKLLELERPFVSKFEKKEFIDLAAIKKEEERLKKLAEFKKQLDANMEKWRQKLNKALFEDDKNLKEDLDKLGDEMGQELNTFQNDLNKCYDSNAACKLKSSINGIRNTKETEMVKPYMQNKMTENENQPHITGANINYGNAFKEMKMKRQEESDKRKEKLDKIEKWYNLRKENLEKRKAQFIEDKSKEAIELEKKYTDTMKKLFKDQTDLEESVISTKLTVNQINDIQKNRKNIDNTIQSTKKDYNDNLKKIQESVQIKEEEFLIIMKQVEDLKDEFITKVYSEY